MDLFAVLDQVIELLRSRGRVSYRVLKLQLQLDDDAIEALKDELIYAQHAAVDEEGRVLVWTGGPGASPAPAATSNSSGPFGRQGNLATEVIPRPADARVPDAERRQLTVLFCDLVDSTVLAGQLDPEEWREVVRAYQETCAKVIARFEGHITQYLGDGLLVYFGYPLAHEDDAQRAVWTGLGIVEAMGQLNIRLGQERGVSLAVRLGIHTGLVVVGEVGGGTRQEQLALGETPNLAARLQGVAAPNTLVISVATYQLLGSLFACQSLGAPPLKGVAQPLEVYQVRSESTARTRLEAAGSTGLTPLVGREQEVALLLERWAQVKDGLGQVVLLSGEAGIGKSRLVQVLQEHVATEPQAWLIPCQCSPYHQHTALYPLIDLLERVALRFEREESPPQKLRKLEGFVVQYGLPLPEVVPLFASLLSIPLGTDYAPLTMSPEQQKQKTLQAFLTILLRIAKQQPVLFVIEDLPWVDPSTLELLTLLVDQGPTARILALFTCRPDFNSPWPGRRLSNYRAELQRAGELGQQLLTLAHQVQDGALLLEAHHALWPTLFYLGELTAARGHLAQGMALYDPEQHRSHAFLYGGHDPGGCCHSYTAWTLWALGYPDQARQSSDKALTLARELAYPAGLAGALHSATLLHQFRRERQAVQEAVEAFMALATEQGNAELLARGMILRGWALFAPGQETAGIGQMRQGLAALQATGGEVRRPLLLALLAEAYGSIGQSDEGLHVLAEALAAVEHTGGRFYEAELYRLTGELLRARAVEPDPEAEACFQQALALARRQEAKSLELRAAMSLSRPWQQQGRRAEARELLAPIYGWFTEGFDTADLQEAKALLDEWS